MKKRIALLMIMVMSLGLLACGSQEKTSTALPFTSVDDAVARIYEVKPVDLVVSSIDVDLADEFAVKSYTGLTLEDTAKIDSAVASESDVNAQAYSLVVVKVNNKDDAADIAKKMADGIDTRKWCCVEADDMKVVYSGQYIMLYMVQSDLGAPSSSDMSNAFKTACGSVEGEFSK